MSQTVIQYVLGRLKDLGVTMVVVKVLAVCLVGLSVELVFVGLNSWGVVEIAGLKAG